MKKILITLTLLTLAASAFAQVFDFKLVNKTGFTIAEVYVSPADDDEWGEDVLGEDVLENKKSVEIEFDSDYEAALLAFNVDKYDLRCELEDGSYEEWYDLKLEDIMTIEISIDKNGYGIATVK